MNKGKTIYLFYFSFLIFHSSLSFSQDTLVLRNGQKMGVKVIFLGYKLFYSIPSSEQKMSIGYSKVMYIKYGNGNIYTINTKERNPKDTIPVKLEPYILFSGGGSAPDPNGYGGSIFKFDPIYSGYALGGYSTSVTGGFNFAMGWELTGQFSYMRNAIDATGFLNETTDMFINPIESPSYNNNISNPTAIGTYYYNNYSALLGISRNYGDKVVSMGFSLMFGDLVTSLSTIHGVTSNDLYFLNLDAETHSDFAWEVGMHMDIKIAHHFFIRGMIDIQISSMTNGGGFQVGDLATGNTIYSGSYSGAVNTNNYPSSFDIDLYNLRLGLGYKF